MSQIDLPGNPSFTEVVEGLRQRLSKELGGSIVHKSQVIRSALMTLSAHAAELSTEEWYLLGDEYQSLESDGARLPFIANQQDRDRMDSILVYLRDQPEIVNVLARSIGGVSRRMLITIAIFYARDYYDDRDRQLAASAAAEAGT